MLEGKGLDQKKRNAEHPTSNAEIRTDCDGMNADINAKSQGREGAKGKRNGDLNTQRGKPNLPQMNDDERRWEEGEN